jgi:hypothetical protein
MAAFSDDVTPTEARRANKDECVDVSALLALRARGIAITAGAPV